MTAKENAQVADERLQFECLARTVRALEERLEQATGLLRRCSDEFNFDEYDDPSQVQLQADVHDFVSRAPAPVAEPAAQTCNHGVFSHTRNLPCPKAETAPQHPDRALLARIEDAVAIDPATIPEWLSRSILKVIKEELATRAQGQGGGNG